jgi:[CysO sulfur-carrier protein]-S-L-cysteine hydrolase
MNAVQIPRDIVNQILHQAQQTPEEEVCGLISGADGNFRRCYPVVNVSADRRRLFELDPRGQIEAMRDMRHRGETLMAIYHSHPDTPPLPSLRDIYELSYPDVLYLIVSLDTSGVLVLRGFQIQGTQVQEIAVRI